LANFPSCVIQLPKISALAPHKKTFLANLIKPFFISYEQHWLYNLVTDNKCYYAFTREY
jgi:hypothetical protein